MTNKSENFFQISENENSSAEDVKQSPNKCIEISNSILSDSKNADVVKNYCQEENLDNIFNKYFEDLSKENPTKQDIRNKISQAIKMIIKSRK